MAATLGQTAVVEALHAGLADLLPAQVVLGGQPDELQLGEAAPGVDYLYVQGRGDRIHAFAVYAPTDSDDAWLSAFVEVGANWLWLAAADGVELAATLAREKGLGLLRVDPSGTLQKLVHPAPRPGIFIKRYPALKKRWRTLSSW